MITHFTWGLGVLQLLSTFDHPDWNLEWARATISFTDVLGKLAAHFGQAKVVLRLDPHISAAEDIFSRSAGKMTWMKSFFENEGSSAGPRPIASCSNPNNLPGLPLANDMDFMDDEWMHDILELW